jgi:zinc D-Ala-D-Ala carboxypeptidase
MILEIKKGSNIALSEDFRSDEFDCKCLYSDCEVTYIDEEHVEGLQKIRGLLHRSIVVISGFRCTKHNKDEDGKPGSLHLIGKASDIIASPKHSSDQLKRLAHSIAIFNNGGIGYSKDFLHLDSRGYAARWNY